MLHPLAYPIYGADGRVQYDMWYTQGFQLSISVGVGSEDNFNESGLTVRQTRFQEAQENISYYQNQLITAAVNPGKDMAALLMQLIAGEGSVSLVTISEYLDSLQQQLEYGEAMMYQATLAIFVQIHQHLTLKRAIKQLFVRQNR